MNTKTARPARTSPGSRRTVRRPASRAPEPALLSPQLGFVVQFHAGAGLAPGAFSGRVEHLVSGRSDHFRDTAELLAFLSRLLVETQTG